MEFSEPVFGVDVGSDGAWVVLRQGSASELVGVELEDLPDDLVARVGDRRPCVTLPDGGGYTIHHGQDFYAAAVERALLCAGAEHRVAPVGHIGVAVPSWWTERACHGATQAMAARGLGSASLVNSAVAAVAAAQATLPDLPDVLLVVDLGARTCSASVVTRHGGIPALVPGTTTVHLEGGTDLDRLILHRVVATLQDLGVDLRAGDPAHVSAAKDYLRRCKELRHELSSSSAVALIPDLPGERHHVRLVREEFEEIAASWRDEVCRIVRSAIAQSPSSVDGVLLVGGLANTPMIGQLISAELDLDVRTVPSPETAVAYGAALLSTPVEIRLTGWARRRASLARLLGLSRSRRGTPESPTILALPAGSSATDAGAESDGRVPELEAEVPAAIVHEAAMAPVSVSVAQEPLTRPAPAFLAVPVFGDDEEDETAVFGEWSGPDTDSSEPAELAAADYAPSEPRPIPVQVPVVDEVYYDALNTPNWQQIPAQRSFEDLEPERSYPNEQDHRASAWVPVNVPFGKNLGTDWLTSAGAGDERVLGPDESHTEDLGIDVGPVPEESVSTRRG